MTSSQIRTSILIFSSPDRFRFWEAISSLTNQELVELSRTNELFVTTMQDSLAFESLLSDFHLRNRSFYLMLLGKSSWDPWVLITQIQRLVRRYDF